MTLVADVFPEVPPPKNILRYMSKKPCFSGPLDTQLGKRVQTLLSSEWQNLYNIFRALLR